MKTANIFLILCATILSEVLTQTVNDNLRIGTGYLTSLYTFEYCNLPQGSYLLFQNDRVKITCAFRNSTYTSATHMSGMELVFSDGELSAKVLRTSDGSVIDPHFITQSADRIPTSSGKPWLDIADSRSLIAPVFSVINDFVSKSIITISTYISDVSHGIEYESIVKTPIF